MRAKCLCSGDLCHVILTSSPLFSSWPQQSWRDYSASCPINGPGPCSLLLSILPIVFPPPQGFSFDLPSKARHWLHFHPGRFSDSQLSGQCVCGGVCACACACTFVCALICVCICTHTCEYVLTCVHVCAYVYVSVHACVHVCVFVCICVYMYVHKCVCVYMLVCMHVCVCTCVCVFVCICVYVCTNVCVCTPMRKCICSCLSVSIITMCKDLLHPAVLSCVPLTV